MWSDFRYAVVVGLADRDVTADLRGLLAAIPESQFSAITELKQASELMHSILDYTGNLCTVAALKISALVFVQPRELRTAEWAEVDLNAAEWRILGSKMKVDYLVPLSTQAVKILRRVHPLTGHGRYVFPSLRTGERPMSENTINAALRGMGYSK